MFAGFNITEISRLHSRYERNKCYKFKVVRLMHPTKCCVHYRGATSAESRFRVVVMQA